jgi:DNA-binding response OmpR family regulator
MNMPKILIIEDNENLSKLMQRVFEGKGFQVVTITDGRQGFEVFKSLRPDVLLLDLALPSMNGYEILEERQKDISLQKIPVLVVSNSGQNVEISRLRQLSADDYMIKVELTTDEIYNKVIALLGKTQNKDITRSDSPEVFEVDAELRPEGVKPLDTVKILWVEDDVFLGSIVSRKLSGTGALYTQATDATSAFAYLESNVPDIIVLDIMLPGMNGFEILEKIKMNPKTSAVPVVVLSNLGQKEDMDKCFKLGATKFFVKALVTLDHIIEEIVSVVGKK